MGRNRRRLPREPVEAEVTALSHEGRGIAHDRGRPVFIDGALPGERVRFRYHKLRRSRGEGAAQEVVAPSPRRIEPGCPHFGYCGGCALQHLSGLEQRRHKETVVAELLERTGRVTPGRWLDPLTGPEWGYRRRARLAVKDVPGKGGVLVGFRERHSPYVAVLNRCPVLDPRVGEHLHELRAAVQALSCRDRIPQIEVACGDDRVGLVFRHLDALNAADAECLADFARETGFAVYSQPGDESTLTPIHPEAPRLSYDLPEWGVQLEFLPTDFVQVNAAVNRKMVAQALEWLQPEEGRRILDLFCGLGNFSLPLASRGAEVHGVEGDAGLVARARRNAEAQGLPARFLQADLTRPEEIAQAGAESYDAVLLDPPRTGAAEVLPAIAASGARRVVYCSCGPATLARDAGTLVHEYGLSLTAVGIMDMFPHTAHVEAFAVLDRAPEERRGERNGTSFSGAEPAALP